MHSSVLCAEVPSEQASHRILPNLIMSLEEQITKVERVVVVNIIV